MTDSDCRRMCLMITMRAHPLATFLAGLLLGIGAPAALGAVQDGLFPDVSPGSSYSSAVSEVSRLGIIRGYDNGRFGPNDPVTRAQAAVMFSRYDHTVIDSLRKQIDAISEKVGIGSCNGHAAGETYPASDG